jgi:hypothetical protein
MAFGYLIRPQKVWMDGFGERRRLVHLANNSIVARDQAAPIIDDSSPTTQRHYLQTLQAGAAVNKDNNDVTPAEPEGEGDLSQELTDLQALRAQIAQLVDEIHTRETWLADAAGLTTAGPGSITDCDRPACIIRDISRKV